MRAHIVPDLDHPNMFRVRWPNGDYSDMVNLSRAKDAIATREIIETNAKKKSERLPRRRRCGACGEHWADWPSDLCPGCDAYREHAS